MRERGGNMSLSRLRRRCLLLITLASMILAGCDGSKGSPHEGSASPKASQLRIVDYGFSVTDRGPHADTLSYGVILQNVNKLYGIASSDLNVTFYSEDHVVIDSDDLRGPFENTVSDVPPGRPAVVSGIVSFAGKQRPDHMTVTVASGVSWEDPSLMPRVRWLRAKDAELDRSGGGDSARHHLGFNIPDRASRFVDSARVVDAQAIFVTDSGSVAGGYPVHSIAATQDAEGWHGQFPVDLSRLPDSFRNDDIAVYLKVVPV